MVIIADSKVLALKILLLLYLSTL